MQIGRLILLAAALPVASPAASQTLDRRVALTYDDLPMTPVHGRCDPATARAVTERLLAGLARARVRATGFVNADGTCGVDPARLRDPILEAWLDAGHELGNHTASHPDLHRLGLTEYLEDARRGGAAIDSLLRARGRSLVWFRHPFLHAGDTAAKKEGLSRFLDRQGWRVAPVTIDNQGWVYAYLYELTTERGDTDLARRVAGAFLDHLDTAFTYFERRSREVVRREIPQVLLLHANRINADHVDDVIARLRARGYRVVPLAEALQDSVYRRGDPWIGPGGPSWIERWAVADGGAARPRPREVARIADAYRDLSAHAPADRRVAITIDDVPYVGGPDSLSRARRVTDALLSVLRKHGVPASGFVVGERVLVEGEVDARLKLLRAWVEAGMRLENHGFGHLSLNRVPFTSYCDDIVRGDLVLRLVEPGDTARFYRPPFNHAGRDSTIRNELLRFLDARGYRLAPFTVEAGDYIYNAIYRDALAHGDTTMAGRALRTYLDQTDRSMAFFDALGRDTFGRSIPQILLFHANDLNAAALDDLLSMLEKQGYRYVPLGEAVEDPAYSTPDGYFGAYGPSWLHRWRIALGLEDRLPDEPDVPPWTLRRYRDLQKETP